MVLEASVVYQQAGPGRPQLAQISTIKGLADVDLQQQSGMQPTFNMQIP